MCKHLVTSCKQLPENAKAVNRQQSHSRGFSQLSHAHIYIEWQGETEYLWRGKKLRICDIFPSTGLLCFRRVLPSRTLSAALTHFLFPLSTSVSLHYTLRQRKSPVRSIALAGLSSWTLYLDWTWNESEKQ